MKKSDIDKLLTDLGRYDYGVSAFQALTGPVTIVVSPEGNIVRRFPTKAKALTWLDAKLDTLRETRREGEES